MNAKKDKQRMCLNCGRTRPADEGRESPHPDCASPDACTWDMTRDEAWQHWREKYHKLRNASDYRILAASNDTLRTAVNRLLKVIDEPYHRWDVSSANHVAEVRIDDLREVLKALTGYEVPKRMQNND